MIPAWWHRPVGPGDTGPDVMALQRLLGLIPDGAYDEATASCVRGLQVLEGLDVTGFVDDSTATALGPLASETITPQWWSGDIHPGEVGWEWVIKLVGDEDGLRRLQGNNHLTPTGVVNRATALRLAGMVLD